jgi:hypothetical protein
MSNQNALMCYRPDGTCYAILSTGEWAALRKAGKLDAELKRRRESGAIVEVTKPTPFIPAPHFKPRGDTLLVRQSVAERQAGTLAAMREFADSQANTLTAPNVEAMAEMTPAERAEYRARFPKGHS